MPIYPSRHSTEQKPLTLAGLPSNSNTPALLSCNESFANEGIRLSGLSDLDLDTKGARANKSPSRTPQDGDLGYYTSGVRRDSAVSASLFSVASQSPTPVTASLAHTKTDEPIVQPAPEAEEVTNQKVEAESSPGKGLFSTFASFVTRKTSQPVPVVEDDSSSSSSSSSEEGSRSSSTTATKNRATSPAETRPSLQSMPPPTLIVTPVDAAFSEIDTGRDRTKSFLSAISSSPTPTSVTPLSDGDGDTSAAAGTHQTIDGGNHSALPTSQGSYAARGPFYSGTDYSNASYPLFDHSTLNAPTSGAGSDGNFRSSSLYSAVSGTMSERSFSRPVPRLPVAHATYSVEDKAAVADDILDGYGSSAPPILAVTAPNAGIKGDDSPSDILFIEPKRSGGSRLRGGDSEANPPRGSFSAAESVSYADTPAHHAEDGVTIVGVEALVLEEVAAVERGDRQHNYGRPAPVTSPLTGERSLLDTTIAMDEPSQHEEQFITVHSSAYANDNNNNNNNNSNTEKETVATHQSNTNNPRIAGPEIVVEHAKAKTFPTAFVKPDPYVRTRAPKKQRAEDKAAPIQVASEEFDVVTSQQGQATSITVEHVDYGTESQVPQQQRSTSQTQGWLSPKSGLLADNSNGSNASFRASELVTPTNGLHDDSSMEIGTFNSKHEAAEDDGLRSAIGSTPNVPPAGDAAATDDINTTNGHELAFHFTDATKKESIVELKPPSFFSRLFGHTKNDPGPTATAPAAEPPQAIPLITVSAEEEDEVNGATDPKAFTQSSPSRRRRNSYNVRPQHVGIITGAQHNAISGKPGPHATKDSAASVNVSIPRIIPRTPSADELAKSAFPAPVSPNKGPTYRIDSAAKIEISPQPKETSISTLHPSEVNTTHWGQLKLADGAEATAQPPQSTSSINAVYVRHILAPQADMGTVWSDTSARRAREVAEGRHDIEDGSQAAAATASAALGGELDFQLHTRQPSVPTSNKSVQIHDAMKEIAAKLRTTTWSRNGQPEPMAVPKRSPPPFDVQLQHQHPTPAPTLANSPAVPDVLTMTAEERSRAAESLFKADREEWVSKMRSQATAVSSHYKRIADVTVATARGATASYHSQSLMDAKIPLPVPYSELPTADTLSAPRLPPELRVSSSPIPSTLRQTPHPQTRFTESNNSPSRRQSSPLLPTTSAAANNSYYYLPQLQGRAATPAPQTTTLYYSYTDDRPFTSHDNVFKKSMEAYEDRQRQLRRLFIHSKIGDGDYSLARPAVTNDYEGAPDSPWSNRQVQQQLQQGEEWELNTTPPTAIDQTAGHRPQPKLYRDPYGIFPADDVPVVVDRLLSESRMANAFSTASSSSPPAASLRGKAIRNQTSLEQRVAKSLGESASYSYLFPMATASAPSQPSPIRASSPISRSVQSISRDSVNGSFHVIQNKNVSPHREDSMYVMSRPSQHGSPLRGMPLSHTTTSSFDEDQYGWRESPNYISSYRAAANKYNN